MTENSATAGAASAGTSADASATAASSGSTAAPASDPFAGLQKAESREWIASKGYKDLDPVVESARYAEKTKAELDDLKGKALTPPAPDAKAEVWDAFYAKMGRPEKPEAYEFKLPEGLPENLPYDADSAAKYKQWSHAAGLTPRQAQMLHDAFVKDTASQFTTMTQAQVQRTEAAHGELVKAWGEPGSESYKTNVKLAERVIAKNGGDAVLGELKAAGLVHESGAVLAPNLAKMLAGLGKHYSEDGLVTGSQEQPRRTAAETLYPPEKDVFARR